MIPPSMSSSSNLFATPTSSGMFGTKETSLDNSRPGGFTGFNPSSNATAAFAWFDGGDNPNSFNGMPRTYPQTTVFGASTSAAFGLSPHPATGTSVFGGMPLSSSASPFGESPSTSSLQSKTISTSPFGTPFFGSSNLIPTPAGFSQSSQTITNANAAFSMGNFSGGFSQPDVKNKRGGSLITSYSPTPDLHGRDSHFALASISAMPIYSDKSHEELRLEDYQLKNEGCSACEAVLNPGGSGLKNQQTSSSSAFTSSSFGGSRREIFSFPPVSSSTALVSNEVPSKSCPTTTSTTPFGAISSNFAKDSNPFISGSSFSTKNVHVTPFGGCSQSQVDQCRGSRIAPYAPTHVCENTDRLTFIHMISISAMHAYLTKSHEELRLEDYQQRNIDKSRPAIPKPASFSFKSDCSNQQPAPSSNLFASYSSASDPFKSFPEPSSDKSTTTSAMGNLSTGASSFAPQDKPDSGCIANIFNQPIPFPQVNRGFNPQAYPVGTSQNSSGSGTHTNNAVVGAFQGTSAGSSAQPFGPGTAYGTSFLPGFVNYTVPHIGSLGSSDAEFDTQPFKPVSSIPVFSFPALVSYAPVTGTIWPPLFTPAFGTAIGLPGSQSARTEILRSTSVGLDGHNESSSDNEVTNTEAVATSFADLQIKEKEGDSDVPKGLHIIIEKLGVNPWAKGRVGKGTPLDYPSEGILPCEEAEKDADILALAQFAVEQHNAMDKDEKVEFVGVVGACLEPVSGGRYHIVLEARDDSNANAGESSGKQKRYYASVLRKLSHLAVLEKWVPGKA